MPETSRFDKLTDGNYYEWKIYMEALLMKKGFFEIVKGAETNPGGSENHKKVREFIQKQQEACAEIILMLSHLKSLLTLPEFATSHF
jgi:hypothetical protein